MKIVFIDDCDFPIDEVSISEKIDPTDAAQIKVILEKINTAYDKRNVNCDSTMKEFSDEMNETNFFDENGELN